MNIMKPSEYVYGKLHTTYEFSRLYPSTCREMYKAHLTEPRYISCSGDVGIPISMTLISRCRQNWLRSRPS